MNSNVMLNMIKQNNSFMYKSIVDQTTRQDVLSLALTMSKEKTSPPDKLPKLNNPNLEKDFIPNSLSQSIVNAYNSMDSMEFATVKIGDNSFPVPTKECKIVKAFLVASVSSNETLVNEVAELTPLLIQNLVQKLPLLDKAPRQTDKYYYHQAYKTIKALLNGETSKAETFTPDDIEEPNLV